jgi:tRNA threonylcarbamoyladenosine biosynthesis protein TsaE
VDTKRGGASDAANAAREPAIASTAPSSGPVVLSRVELEAWGEAYGREVSAPRLVAIDGDLGAGKTTLIQAICRGYGVARDVTSPTFALVHEYRSRRGPVFHLDLYRLRNADELTNIGWDDIVNADALVFVEWPERAGARLPATAARISLAHVTGRPDHRALSAT